MTNAISSAELLAEFRQAIQRISGNEPDSGSFYPGSSPITKLSQKQLDMAALKTGIATLVYLDSRGRISYEFSKENLSATEKARELNQDPDAVGVPLLPFDPAVFAGTSREKKMERPSFSRSKGIDRGF